MEFEPRADYPKRAERCSPVSSAHFYTKTCFFLSRVGLQTHMQILHFLWNPLTDSLQCFLAQRKATENQKAHCDNTSLRGHILPCSALCITQKKHIILPNYIQNQKSLNRWHELSFKYTFVFKTKTTFVRFLQFFFKSLPSRPSYHRVAAGGRDTSGPHASAWHNGSVFSIQDAFLSGSMSTGQMGCRAFSGQNKMALSVLKTPIRSGTK